MITVNKHIFFVVFIVLVLKIKSCFQMVLRLNEGGLEDLADYTRAWMSETIMSSTPIRLYTHKIDHNLAANGEFLLENITIKEFTPPKIRYQPSHNSLLYMITDGGSMEISAQWTVNSEILSLFKIQKLNGNVYGRIKGFSSDISVQITPKNNELVMHQCVARFEHFNLRLSGSLAADLLQWFHRLLAKALQSRVEEAYCQLTGQKLFPWLRHQLEKFSQKFHFQLGNELRLTQSLSTIRTDDGHIDLEMINQLTTSKETILIQTENVPMKPSKFEIVQNNNRVELFMDEKALQQLLNALHNSNLFVTNFTSPFLTVNCTLFCIGKLIPQMAVVSTHNAPLYAVIRTRQAPVIRLVDQRIRLRLNISFEIFNEKPMRKKREVDRAELINQQNVEGILDGEKGSEIFERIKYLHPKNDAYEHENLKGQISGNSIIDNVAVSSLEEEEKPDEEYVEASEELTPPPSTPIVRPPVDVNEPPPNLGKLVVPIDFSNEVKQNIGKITWKNTRLNRPLPPLPLPSRLLPQIPENLESLIVKKSKSEEEWALGGSRKSTKDQLESGEVIWPKFIGTKIASKATFSPLSPFTFPVLQTTAMPTVSTDKNNNGFIGIEVVIVRVERPILKIEIDSDVELALSLSNRRINSALKFNNVKALLTESQMSNLSQNTVDLIVDTSVPFIENAVRIFYRDGVVLDEVLQMPTRNATLDIEDGFIRLKADLNLVNLLL